ncbi:MAG TPA: bile acid:sodium symporter family protein [Planctomycetes bacterium]|nr:bile acid:sodium symporter family protein [Planctomycetota bacterium]
MVLTVDYEKKTLGERGKNKPNSNPIQTQSNPIKANKMPKQSQNKPKTKPISKAKKMRPKAQPNILALSRLRLILSNIMFTRLLSFYTKYFALWVVLLGIVAYFFPAPFVALKPYNEWFFALTMFGIGAVLEINDFKRIAQKPTIVLIGCCAQFSIMPLGAFVLSKLFGLPPEIAIGLILTGSAPGAMASNVMSYIAKADTAYSVSLTTVSTLLCPLLTPGLTFLLAGSVLKVDFLAMVISVLQMVIIPLFIGFGVRHYFRKKIENVLPIFPAISVTFIIFICSLVIALNRNYLIMITGPILAAGLILNIYGMLAGYGVASAFRMANIRKRTLAIEIGMQNAGLGTVLALKHFGRKAAMPAAIFVFICIITASIMAEVWQKRQVTE